MNKFGLEFMGKFELGGVGIEEFFGEDWELINKKVNKGGWYRYENCRGYVEIDYIGDKLKDEEELRNSEKDFMGEYWESEKREDFIDIEEVCYVKVQ